jgi:hypothetical protein
MTSLVKLFDPATILNHQWEHGTKAIGIVMAKEAFHKN